MSSETGHVTSAEFAAPPKPQFDAPAYPETFHTSEPSPPSSLQHYISPLGKRRGHAAPAPASPFNDTSDNPFGNVTGYSGFGYGNLSASPKTSILSSNFASHSPFSQYRQFIYELHYDNTFSSYRRVPLHAPEGLPSITADPGRP
jgi:hypothetical protein